MAGIRLLNIFDVARALGPDPMYSTPQRVARWLTKEYLPKKGGGFNYDSAMKSTYDLFRGAASLVEAKKYCEAHGSPIGRKQNVAVVEKIAPYAMENVSDCYRIPFTAVEIGRISGKTVYVGIKAPMVRVRGREAFVVVPGYRMGFRPEEAEIDTACSIALAHLARDDFSKADFEYLYAGPGEDGERAFKAILGRDRKIFDRDLVDSLLDVYVKGVALVAASGVDLRPPRLAGYRVIDSDQPSIF